MDLVFYCTLSPADLESLCIQIKKCKVYLLILQMTLSCTWLGLEFKMIFVNWRVMEEADACVFLLRA